MYIYMVGFFYGVGLGMKGYDTVLLLPLYLVFTLSLSPEDTKGRILCIRPVRRIISMDL